MDEIPVTEFVRRVDANELPRLDVMPEGVQAESGTIYARPPERELRVDAYYRRGKPLRPRSAFVFVHGGAWVRGMRTVFGRQSAYLAAVRDIVVFSPEYRFAPQALFPACLHDVKCAVRYVRSRAVELGIDTEKIAVGGGSAGGHLAALLSVTAGEAEYEGDGGYPEHSSRAAACIPFNGALDLVDLARRIPQPLALFGKAFEEAEGELREASPFFRAHAGAPPFLFLHGEDDRTIPCEQSRLMHEKLASLGVHSEIETYPGKGHGWFHKSPDFAITLKRLERFLVDRFALA